MKRNRKAQSHRYYMQNCIEPPIEVNGKTKVLKVPYPDFKSIPVGQRYYVGELIRYGYLVEYKLFDDRVMEEIKVGEAPPVPPLKEKKTRVRLAKPKPFAEQKQLDLFKY